MNPAEWLVRTARLSPDGPALLQGERTVADYAAFAARAAAIGGALREQYNVHPGDRVAIFMKNRTEYLEVLYGAWFAGAVVVPINAKLHAKEAAWIIEDTDAEVVFVIELSNSSKLYPMASLAATFAMGYPVAFEANADERETLGLISIAIISSFSSLLTAN